MACRPILEVMTVKVRVYKALQPLEKHTVAPIFIQILPRWMITRVMIRGTQT